MPSKAELRPPLESLPEDKTCPWTVPTMAVTASRLSSPQVLNPASISVIGFWPGEPSESGTPRMSVK